MEETEILKSIIIYILLIWSLGLISIKWDMVRSNLKRRKRNECIKLQRKNESSNE